MKFIQVSPMEIINMENVTHITINQMHDIAYTTLHFVGGQTYRCTEEESILVVKFLKDVATKPE